MFELSVFCCLLAIHKGSIALVLPSFPIVVDWRVFTSFFHFYSRPIIPRHYFSFVAKVLFLSHVCLALVRISSFRGMYRFFEDLS